MKSDDDVDPALTSARGLILKMFSAALAAVEPAHAVREALAFHDDLLTVGDVAFTAPAGFHVVGVGKAAVAMTQGALEALDGAIRSGDVITKEGHVDRKLPPRFRVHEASHPIPDERGVRATNLALEALSQLDPATVVLALISGGGSALLEAPRDGVTLDDLAKTTDILLRAGAPIGALNAVRSPLSKVKAGGLREAAPANRFVTLILSDVLGNDPRTIASGPTVAAEREGRAALEVVDHFGVRELLPEGVVRTLAMAAPRREPVHCSQDILRIIGDNATAVMAAAREAERRGLRVDTRWRAVEGEAADLGRAWVAEAAEASESVDIMLGGGEATVTVRGDGLGGRNTEFALAAALELERRSMGGWVIASLATDGQDALTGMAGAIADAGTCERARRRGVDPELALARNDSLAAFVAAGGAVDTGPTGTNVNDLYSAVRARRMREAE